VSRSRAKDIEDMRREAHGRFLDAGKPGAYQYVSEPEVAHRRGIALSKDAMPTVPMAATLSAAQLAAFICPAGLQRLLIAQDNDPVGRAAAAALAARAAEAGLMTVVLAPRRSDFNDDLRSDGAAGLVAHVRTQLERHGLGDLCPDAP
jgi:hypothetical protein